VTAWDLYTLTLITLGALFFLAGTLGLLRFPDTLTRLHALTKADNLGLGLVVLGLLPQVPWPATALKLIAVWLLALLAGATAGQLLGKQSSQVRAGGMTRKADQESSRD
jgi:multicomponent Na+:H+ antiporter subunit G